MLVKNKKGFTLVEILVVMAILLLMIVILIGILNPIALVNKARDNRRKKDLNRIKVAFEEYYNDNGCYPNNVLPDELLTKLMLPQNCGTLVFGKWLNPWPCDPNNKPYIVMTGYDPDCPKWFKILTTLENKNDPDINVTALTENDSNYAISSGNIVPGGYLGEDNPYCVGLCHVVEDGSCNVKSSCFGSNCFRGAYNGVNCHTQCQVNNCP